MLFLKTRPLLFDNMEKTPADMMSEILGQLDGTYGVIGFFEGNKAREYPIDCRLRAWRRGVKWSITMERLIYSPVAVRYQKSIIAGIYTWIFCWGNCLRLAWKPIMKPRVVRAASDPAEGAAFIRKEGDRVPILNRRISKLLVRGEPVPLENRIERYSQLGINPIFSPDIRPFEALRALAGDGNRDLLATNDEINTCLRTKILPREVLTLCEWRNPFVDEKPSEVESIRMIAEAIAWDDSEKYRPIELPNTHWSNSPRAGSFDED